MQRGQAEQAQAGQRAAYAPRHCTGTPVSALAAALELLLSRWGGRPRKQHSRRRRQSGDGPQTTQQLKEGGVVQAGLRCFKSFMPGC